MGEVDKNELTSDLAQYTGRIRELAENRFDRSTLKEFRAYYDHMHGNLVSYILMVKDQDLSDRARRLPVMRDLMAGIRRMSVALILLLMFSVVIAFIIFDPAYRIWLNALVLFDAVAVFFLIRGMRRESAKIASHLQGATRDIKKVLHIIEQDGVHANRPLTP